MKNILVAILIASVLIPMCVAYDPVFPANKDGYLDCHSDVVLKLYNATCLETANYEYVFIQNTDVDPIDLQQIWVMVIKDLGPKSILADITY